MIALLKKVFHFVERLRHIKAGRMELKKRLRQARKDAKMGVQEVADFLDVGRAQVWRMEVKNADFISISRLRKLADLYGRPIEHFFDDKLEIEGPEISYQLIGMAIAAAEAVATKLPERPSPEALQAATLAVIRTQQKRWADDPTRRFNPEEYIALIEQKLDEEYNP
ncbi:helix-turn-helix transcriptional regulator [Alisedimentitalea sp. MJ-SS2]|uniref:helix-turn-helix domain-containing protein n=1 Tax=Aliisedimentitalea sp. MJ-SS2 TaxID=3049795 RepID=UPI0029081C79|nr:helix-turn-helix transcriptional regulator [Alisedimentitalea sp. MJ-SS2]MDU8928311.1 helix-turn-helix transcriptional regulator [Alisedimentitalea sp. MJ-SS2]